MTREAAGTVSVPQDNARPERVCGGVSAAIEKGLVYGQSVTDACIGWEDTVKLLNDLARAVRDRRSRNS